MTNHKIEEELDHAIRNETPDMLSQLMQETGLSEKPRKAQARTRRYFRPLAAVAAALALFAGGMAYANRAPAAPREVAMVGLDVNPSVEIYVDEEDRVVRCEALNPEGEAILKSMDLTGIEIRTAANAIVGAMVAEGYLTDTHNSILVTVTAKDAKKGRALEEDLAQQLHDEEDGDTAGMAVLSQYVEPDEETEEFAGSHGISLGKAWVIRQLAASDPKLTEESLLKLSTQELILLWSGHQDKMEKPGAILTGRVDTSEYISSDTAIQAALTAAGTNSAAVTGLSCDFDCEDGVLVYEVEFFLNGTEYEIDVDARSGSVLKVEAEGEDDSDDAYDEDGDDVDDTYDTDDDTDDQDDTYDLDDEDDEDDDADDEIDDEEEEDD